MEWIEDSLGAEEGSVTSLDLSGRSNPRLDSLPHTLTSIDLSRCRLESLDALRQLRALELLNVSFNRLTSLAPVASATRLSVLYARSNRLRSPRCSPSPRARSSPARSRP